MYGKEIKTNSLLLIETIKELAGIGKLNVANVKCVITKNQIDYSLWSEPMFLLLYGHQNVKHGMMG